MKRQDIQNISNECKIVKKRDMKDFKFNILRFMLTKIYEADYNNILFLKKQGQAKSVTADF